MCNVCVCVCVCVCVTCVPAIPTVRNSVTLESLWIYTSTLQDNLRKHRIFNGAPASRQQQMEKTTLPYTHTNVETSVCVCLSKQCISVWSVYDW